MKNPMMPLDLDAALQSDTWRSHFVFPLSHKVARDFDDCCSHSFLEAIAAEPSELVSDIYVHAIPFLWMTALGLLEHAMIIQHGKDLGLDFWGGDAILYRMQGKPIPVSVEATRSLGLLPSKVPQAALRRIARTASWTPTAGLLKALLAPNVCAVSHNGLLVSEATRSAQRISYKHADTFLHGWEKVQVPEDLETRILERFEAVARCFTLSSLLRPEYRDALEEVLWEANRPSLMRSAKAVLATRRLRNVPKELWSGSSGYFPVRAMHLEVRRRGGICTSFDHGGSLGFVDEPVAFAMLEQIVTDNYVMPTNDLAKNLRVLPQQVHTSLLPNCHIAGGLGDKSFSPLETYYLNKRSPAKQPRVIYVTGMFGGMRQRIRPRIHDIPNLDWQLRLTEILNKLNIDLVCQPHPEGALDGRPHPMGKLGRLSNKRFEDIVSWADVVVTDIPLSTTTWKLGCMEKAVVMIDLDMVDFNPAHKSLLKRRFRIVQAEYDYSNLPQINQNRLEDAIRTDLTSDERAASAEFRELLTGAA